MHVTVICTLSTVTKRSNVRYLKCDTADCKGTAKIDQGLLVPRRPIYCQNPLLADSITCKFIQPNRTERKKSVLAVTTELRRQKLSLVLCQIVSQSTKVRTYTMAVMRAAGQFGMKATLSVFLHAGVLIIISVPNHYAVSLYSPFKQHNHCIPHITACQEFAHLSWTPTLFSIISFRSRSLRSRNPFLCAFFLLYGDVEPNPGPTNFTLCTLNIRSILQPLHSAALCDLIDYHHPDLFCRTETWIKPTTTFTEFKHCTPPNYTVLSFPRTYSDISSLSSGGGTGFLIRERFTQLLASLPDFSSFESSNVTLKLPHTKLSVFNIYHPPPSIYR